MSVFSPGAVAGAQDGRHNAPAGEDAVRTIEDVLKALIFTGCNERKDKSTWVKNHDRLAGEFLGESCRGGAP